MVHRSGSTLILAPNDADHSQNLPQFLDGLDPCAVSTEIQTKKSTLPSNAEDSIVSTPRTPRSLAQNNKKPRKSLTTPKKIQNPCLNNDTAADESNDDTKRISPPFRIRSGLRSNSLESNIFLRPNEDAIISGLVTPRRRGRKMRKKRKDMGGELKKCKSAEIICDDSQDHGDDLTAEHPTKLTCSLPLERLSGYLDTILLSARYNLSDSKLSITTDTAEEDSPNSVNVGKNDSPGHSSHLIKSLCLYCDKKFSSQKVRIKHTERVHAISKGRRLSSRNSLSCSSNLSFPGCSYCCYNSNKLKIVTVSEDLKSLFHHLLDFHSDRYFACKVCAIRFPNSEDLENHHEEKHKIGYSSKSKSISIKKKGKISPLDNSFGVDSLKTTPAALQVDTTSSSDKASSLGDDVPNDPESTPTKTRRQLKQAMENKPLTTRSCQNVLRNDEAILSRLGVAQNRLPRGRRGVRNRRICNIEPSKIDCPLNAVKTRSKVGRVVTSIIMDPMEPAPRPPTNSRVEVLSCTFDEDFYETVNFNVRKNLSCHLDGKLDGGSTSPSSFSSDSTVPTIRSTVVRSPLNADSEIHEATTLSTVTAFPTLLTAEQYGSDIIGATKIKRPITKHSWKWKWDCVKKYKYVNEGGKIVKKVKQPVAGFRDLSKLDMWTQLKMRSKHEMAQRQHNQLSGLNEVLGIGEAAREEKRKQIAQLNAILDTRRLPQIILEQSEQTIIKLELSDESNLTAPSPTVAITPQIQLPLEDSICDLRHPNNDYEYFPKMLHLSRRDLQTSSSQEDLILSGEWARPRCYICFGCGAKFDKLKTLEEHKVFRHPYVYSTHYEIVGRELIEGDLFKHFYIPTKALNRYKEYKQRITKKTEGDGKIGFNENSTCGEESMDSVTSVPISYSTGTSRSDCDTESKTVFASTSSSVTTSAEIEEESILKFHGNCTKCRRECGGILELYRHMLDCSGDYAWILAKKKKYRYFGVRRKRNARHNLPLPRRKINKDSNGKTENIDGIQKPKNYYTPRPKPSDAESIRRMLENLPAKRACRQIIPNVTKPRVRKIPQGILVKKGKNGKKSKGNMANTTVTAITKRILRNHNKRIYTRHLRQVRTAKKTNKITKTAKNMKNKNKKVKNSIVVSSSTEVVINDEEKKAGEQQPFCPPMEEDNVVQIAKNESSAECAASSTATSKNVVKALGKKTRRFVKKITEKFQSNTKAFLNKKSLKKNNTTSSSAATAENVEPKKQQDNEEANCKQNINENENKETENTSTTKMTNKKKFLKGNSKTLLRKLSFRKSSRNNRLSPTKQSALEEENNSQACAEEVCTFKETKVSVVEDTLDNKNKNVDISSTNLQTAQSEKILKKKTFKKILNKFKDKPNKKFSNSKETENKPDTAVIVNEKKYDNDDIIRNCEIEIYGGGGAGVGDGDDDDDTTIVKNDCGKDIVIKENLESQKEENVKVGEIIKSIGDSGDPNISSINLDIQPLNLSLPSQPILQVSPSTKRRSKKLNDCIAMLTGKLQEKLGKPFFESTENLDSALSRQSSTTDVSTPQDSNISSFFSTDMSGALNLECGKKLSLDDSFDRKPPKRKTVTRKIIKKSGNSCSSDSVNKETMFGCGGGGGGNVTSSSIVLRPPVLKISSPKQGTYSETNTFSGGDCNFKVDNSNIETEAGKIKILKDQSYSVECEEKIVENVIIADKTNLTFVDVTAIDRPQEITNLTSTTNTENDSMSSIINFDKNENKSVKLKDETLSNVLLKVKKKPGRKKKQQSSVSGVADSPNTTIDDDGINGVNLIVSKNTIDIQEIIPVVVKEDKLKKPKDEENRVPCDGVLTMTDKKNLPKKKPGRKPKRSIITNPENNQDVVVCDSSENSLKLWEISKNCDITLMKKNDDGDNNLNNLSSSEKVVTAIISAVPLTTPFSESDQPISNFENLNKISSQDSPLFSEPIGNDSISEVVNIENIPTNKVGTGSKKVGRRKTKAENNKVGDSSSSTFEVIDDMDDVTFKPLGKKLKLTAEKPVVEASEDENILITQKKKTKGRPKKNSGKNNIKTAESSTTTTLMMMETENETKARKIVPDVQNENVKMCEVTEIASPPLKRKPGRKKKIKEVPEDQTQTTTVIETTQKLEEMSGDVNNKLEIKQNSQQSPSKPETRKYTRKNKIKSDPKPSTSSDYFDTLKFFPDSTVDSDNIINLHEENQLPATASEESVTLQNALPLSESCPPISLKLPERRVSEERIMKNKKNAAKSEHLKGGKKLHRTNNHDKSSQPDDVDAQELENTGNILKNNSLNTKSTTIDSNTQSLYIPNLMNIEEKNSQQEKSFTHKSRSNRCNKMQSSEKNSKMVVGSHVLTEVEEIVASFFTDDSNKLVEKNLEQNSTDKPIRLDEAEAILAEHNELEEKSTINTFNTEPAPQQQEEQQNNITTTLVQNDEAVSSTAADVIQMSSPPKDNSLNSNNDTIRIICRELSVSLVKLTEDTVNSMKEGNLIKESTMTTKRKGKKTTSPPKQKNQKNDSVNIINNKIDPKTQVKEDIHHRSRSKSTHNPVLVDDAIVSNNTSKLSAQESSKTADETVVGKILEGREENKKTEKLKNQQSSICSPIDETSIYSNLKSQDGSETDTRPDSATKKQRKRRKNELAAIVADQLLESFKEVDKSKIDDLKMLENLAYEKSEDLLLTGMRLTPTTKRINITATTASLDIKDQNINQSVNSKEIKNQKRKSGEHSQNRKPRSKSQPNHKKSSIDVVDAKATVDSTTEKEDDQQTETLTKKRKTSNSIIISNSHENLFRSLTKHDEPIKLNAEPLAAYKHNFKICSNFNTTQFEVFSTFKNSFDNFRSLTDFSFMNKKDIVRKSNFVPGSTETSNSVDSQILKQDDLTKTCDTAASSTGDKTKLTTSVHKKLKKKLSRKKEKKGENENINELRTGLELFSFEKDANNKDILISKSGLNFSNNDRRQTRSPIIAKSHFSISSPDLFNSVTKSFDFLQPLNENKKPLLRPSILTATLEAPRPSIILDTLTSSEVSSKSISSRDPRLNKNKNQTNSEDNNDKPESKTFERRKMGSIRQRRKSESNLKKNQSNSDDIDDLNTAFLHPKERLRSARKEKNLKQSPIEMNDIKNPIELERRTEEDDDNYLFQIAKSVNDKIMSSEDEDDGFEMCNTDSALLLAAEGTIRPSTSMSLRSMPNFNDDQSNGEFLQEDDNTNTELIDMDLEDDMSVYTSFSQDVSRFAGKGKFGSKRRRRKSILFTRKPKKQSYTSDQPDEVFNCDICNKSFRKAAALGKHQMTLTHIAKLSEHEYLNASKIKAVVEEESERRQQELPKSLLNNVEHDIEDDKPTEDQSHQSDSFVDLEMEDKESEPVEELVNEGEAAAAMPVETEVPPEPVENVVEKPPPPPHPSMPGMINLLNQSGIEPISSPEQVESNYDRYQNISSRITLSQEERLFYECCNMLKGSETPMVERTYPIVPYSAYDVPNKPVTPKSSERFSYLGPEVTRNFHHGTAYTVKSPMSQSRTSPRHAYPKIDVNQFSDISSDSNPAFPRGQPHPNLQSNLNYPSSDLANKGFTSYTHHQSPVGEVQNSTTGISSFGQEVPPHNYQEPFFSAEGSFTPTQFPNATDGNPASLTARTFVNEDHVKDFNAGRETITIPAYPSEIANERNQGIPVQNQNFTSPIHSTSSEGSTTTICRMKTKAAMKGYDNFKVSIPTLGLDMQQALERSPHGGCKLTALAEIALGNEVPIASSRYPPIQIREEICDKPKVKPDINEKFVKKYQELIKSNMEPAVPKTPKKKEVVEKIGNKLGFKAKKNKGRASKNCEVSKSPEKQKDIYEFDDSEEMEPNEIKSPIRGGRTGKPNEEKIVIPERPFKDIGLDEQQGIKFHKPDELNNQNEESIVSSTSYSDRDDFNYGSMTDDNEDANQDEEGSSESESNSSARTAKTIENKCLIMGRIFKKATKNRPEDKTDEKNSPEQKKKLPTQELNKLFDSLRGEIKEMTDVIESTTPTNVETNTTNPLHDNIPAETIVVNLAEKPNDSVSLTLKKVGLSKNENPDSMEQNKQELKQTEENTTDLKIIERKSSEVEAKGRKEIRRRSRRDTTTQQHSKEISKLQSELGMSAEEIVNLISEGKRKSQRRCAANRVQKFVETWSSDEYEDFLSTKDIIAFIEEKEKKTRKRKSTSRNSEKKKSTDVTSTKVENGSASNTQNKPDKLKDADAAGGVERNINSSKTNVPESTNNKKSEKIVDKLLEKINKAQKGVVNSNGNKEESVKPSDVSSSVKSDKEKKPPSIKTPETTTVQKKPTLSAKPRLKNRTADSESDFEAELRQSKTTKIKKRRKTISFKEQEIGKKLSKPADASRKLPGKSSSKANHTSKENSSAKSSAQTEGARPQARRKRVASEMLYYWSSSSDEEFGRIETRDDDDDDIAPEGEHYQQHGWIVGDSHKKLVTLLAIAKGKKVEDCGVKEAGYKKKS